MNRTIAVISGSLVAAASLVATTAHANPSATHKVAAVTPGPDPEHARLVALCGTWDVEMTFIEERIEGTLNGTPFTTLAWTGFNTGTQLYEATRIASTNTARIAETGAWDEQARRFELKATYPLAGEMWTQRTIIQPTSTDTMVATSYLSFGAVPEWKAVEIKYARRSK